MKYPKVLKVKAIDNYCLVIKFETEEIKIFDVKPYIKGSWFEQLKDMNIFKTVKPCFNTVEWDNGQDIAPEDLYELSELLDYDLPSNEEIEAIKVGNQAIKNGDFVNIGDINWD